MLLFIYHEEERRGERMRMQGGQWCVNANLFMLIAATDRPINTVLYDGPGLALESVAVSSSSRRGTYSTIYSTIYSIKRSVVS